MKRKLETILLSILVTSFLFGCAPRSSQNYRIEGERISVGAKSLYRKNPVGYLEVNRKDGGKVIYTYSLSDSTLSEVRVSNKNGTRTYKSGEIFNSAKAKLKEYFSKVNEKEAEMFELDNRNWLSKLWNKIF